MVRFVTTTIFSVLFLVSMFFFVDGIFFVNAQEVSAPVPEYRAERDFFTKRKAILLQNPVELWDTFIEVIGTEKVLWNRSDGVAETLPHFEMDYRIRAHDIDLLRGQAIENLTVQFCLKYPENKYCRTNVWGDEYTWLEVAQQ